MKATFEGTLKSFCFLSVPSEAVSGLLRPFVPLLSYSYYALAASAASLTAK